MTEKAYSVADLKALGYGGTTFLYEQMKTGALRARKIGSKTAIMQSDLDAWLAQLPPYQPRHAA